MMARPRVAISRRRCALSDERGRAAEVVADERLVVLRGNPDRRGRSRLVAAGGLAERLRVDRTRLELLRAGAL